ncbi:MAG: class I SAM-dependent methyltransferase [Marinicaulis sp.]|nr:class I SAM-dependent methyltransferase [Marinicaulis sp.]
MYRHTSFELYWQTGISTARVIEEKINGNIETKTPIVADWGCGLGRIIRHLPSRYSRYGFDYNGHAIKWNRNNLADIIFKENDLLPPLPVGANAFDAIYALSVFTHLSEQAHELWIDEIFRCLKPGGIFLGAFHMRPASEQLLPLEREKFDAGKLVIRGGVKEGSRTFTAHHPEDYLRKRLFAKFEILEGPIDLFGQELFIVRKPTVGAKPERIKTC